MFVGKTSVMRKPFCLIIGTVIMSLLFSFFSCGIRPVAWSPGEINVVDPKLTPNENLTRSQKIDLKGWYGPEDIVFDSLGNLYCGVHNKDFSDGRILRIDTNGNVEEFYNSGSWVAGLHFDAKHNLIALSHKQGLISINTSKNVTVLADHDTAGNRFFIPNGIDIASDGKIYFTNTSEVAGYTLRYGRKLILEMRPHGALYCFDPHTNEIKTLIDGTYFGNGVVLSDDETYLLMVETTKYRVLKYWLKGEKKGQTAVFADNLQGFPNGISADGNGNYWLGFTTKRNAALDNIHPKPAMKKMVYGLPGFLQPKAERFGMIFKLAANGCVIQALYDTKGKVIPEAGAVKEQKGYLYIGGDELPYIGKYRL